MIKKIIKSVLSVVGVLAVLICVGFAIKMPSVYSDLLGIEKDSDSATAGIPYVINFGNLGKSDSSYKTQYFKSSNKSWYLSWGNYGSTNHTDENDNFNMLLGWNFGKSPVYGGYSYTTQVMQNIEVPENANYSYVLMDFDFTINHLMEWSFNSFEKLTTSNYTKVHLIYSDNSGSSWSIKDTVSKESLKKDEILTFQYTQESLIAKKSRYGLVLVSDSSSARIELQQMYAQRLSVV